MIIEDITALENKFTKEIMRQCPGAGNPIVKIGLRLNSSACVLSNKTIESMLANVQLNIQLDEYFIQVGITVERERGYPKTMKQRIDITAWPLSEQTVKEETVQLSDTVGFQLRFTSPSCCTRILEAKGDSLAVNLIAENIHRQIEILQAVGQLQQIIKGIVPTVEAA